MGIIVRLSGIKSGSTKWKVKVVVVDYFGCLLGVCPVKKLFPCAVSCVGDI